MDNRYESTTRKEAASVTPHSSFLTLEEESLLACARAGDPTAFAKLVMPHREAILRVTQRILRNREDAEDAVQTTFLAALSHLGDFRARSRFSSWLTRIALNAAFMRLRKVRKECEMSFDQMVEAETSSKFQVVQGRPNPEQEYLAAEQRDLLEGACRMLGSHHFQILYLRHVQELSVAEAALILGVPVGTVKARLYRARFSLTRAVSTKLAQEPKFRR